MLEITYQLSQKGSDCEIIEEGIQFYGRSYLAIGFIAHHGPELDSGHYTSLMKSENSWWHCNDDRCHKVTDESAMLRDIRGGPKFTSYVLMYKATN